LLEQYPGVFKKREFVQSPLAHLESLMQYVPIREKINSFWLNPKNRQSATWMAHRNINMVMLATSLAPEGHILL